MKHVILKNIHNGKGNRQNFIYAELYDAETGELLISAIIDYILEVCKYRNYLLVKENEKCPVKN